MVPPRKLFVTAGQRFGRGTVIDPEIRMPHGKHPSHTERGVRLRCDCGAVYDALLTSLTRGDVVSCGCFRAEVSARNIMSGRTVQEGAYRLPPARGMARHPLYGIWKGVLDRCENPRNKHWRRYGGRGITVYGPWHDVRVFIKDIEAEIGTRPARCPECGGAYSLDRIRNSRGYEPGNVRWANAVVQNGNKGD